MSNLLHLVRFAPKALQRKGAVPLLMEFPVAPETAPFLVTSTGSLQWISEAFKGDIVRAAVRRDASKDGIFREALEAIVIMGREAEWGNILPFTEEGLRAAIEHVSGYDLEDLEILVPKVREAQHELGAYQRPPWLDSHGLRVCPTSWLPDDNAVVVPKNREYVGFVGLVGTGLITVIHNASRGIGVLRGA